MQHAVLGCRRWHLWLVWQPLMAGMHQLRHRRPAPQRQQPPLALTDSTWLCHVRLADRGWIGGIIG